MMTVNQLVSGLLTVIHDCPEVGTEPMYVRVNGQAVPITDFDLEWGVEMPDDKGVCLSTEKT